MAIRKNKWFPEGSPGSIQRDGFISIKNLLAYLTIDMRMLGYTLLIFSRSTRSQGIFNVIDYQAQTETVFNTLGACDPTPPDVSKFIAPNSAVTQNEVMFAMFESNEYVDQLSWGGDPCDPCVQVPTERYRVLFVIPENTPTKMQIYVGAPNILGYTHNGEQGDYEIFDNAAMSPNYATIKTAGELAISKTTTFFDPIAHWGMLTMPANDPFRSMPLSYRLSVSDHGFFLSLWPEVPNATGEMKHCWLLVQRHVNPSTGLPAHVGRCPLWCLYSVDPKIVWKTVVREQDVLVHSKHVRASEHYTDSTAIVNIQKQTVITESNQYVVTFPNGLNTDRFCYVEELDMIGYTSADVIGHNGTAEFTMYGEEAIFGEADGLRVYTAQHANMAYATGMRLLVQTKGPGVTAERDLVIDRPNSIIYTA